MVIKGTMSVRKFMWLPKITQDACGLWDRCAKNFACKLGGSQFILVVYYKVGEAPPVWL